jgi:phosphoenolpyruvate synthase/pyruvate phosphate dikinase
MSLLLPLDDPQAVDPERFGPKAANLAALNHAGLPTPGGFCLDAEAYRIQLAALGLAEKAEQVAIADLPEARRLAVEIRLALYQGAIAPPVLDALLIAWRAVSAQGPEHDPEKWVPVFGKRSCSTNLVVVRSSALIEDRAGATFAGQFESFLGLASETDFLTAVRACWAALWTTNARRYMETHDLDAGETAMAVLIQPLVEARASGGGLSRTGEDQMLLSATWGLGSAIAQGEVVPDRILLSRQGFVRKIEPGRKGHSASCVRGHGEVAAPVDQALVAKPCLEAGQATQLGRMLRKAEDVLGMPVEIEWALDDNGFKLLQARPLHVEAATVPDEIWLRHPGLNGHPAGIGWGTGRACVVNCECELSRVAPGDVLVTKVAGPSLSYVLPRVAGVVAELGGSTSHLASLARERGIPMVLGVLDATRQIPDGVPVAVDGVAGVVRWMR